MPAFTPMGVRRRGYRRRGRAGPVVTARSSPPETPTGFLVGILPTLPLAADFSCSISRSALDSPSRSRHAMAQRLLEPHRRTSPAASAPASCLTRHGAHTGVASHIISALCPPETGARVDRARGAFHYLRCLQRTATCRRMTFCARSILGAVESSLPDEAATRSWNRYRGGRTSRQSELAGSCRRPECGTGLGRATAHLVCLSGAAPTFRPHRCVAVVCRLALPSYLHQGSCGRTERGARRSHRYPRTDHRNFARGDYDSAIVRELRQRRSLVCLRGLHSTVAAPARPSHGIPTCTRRYAPSRASTRAQLSTRRQVSGSTSSS